MPFEGEPRHKVFAFDHQIVPFERVVANRRRFSFDEIAMGFVSYSPRYLHICVLVME